MRFTSSFAVTVSLLLALFTASAWAQNIPADVYKVDYFSHANTAGAPDGTLRITNPGTTNAANLCAYIAVFDPYEEMSECCGCLVTPDGLATLSVNTDLTSNPVTGMVLQTGVIKIVSSLPAPGNTCPLPTGTGGGGGGGTPSPFPTLDPALRSWSTHIQSDGAGFVETEGSSQYSNLSKQELFDLGQQCSAIQLVGSGKGICSCGVGGNT
jgi:hypothetical protein